jgi:tetratricopeptide (TPR) repeat protein
MSSAETFLAQAVAAVNRGDWSTAADRFERAARVLAIVRPTDAVAALESAARLRLMVDDTRKAAEDIARAVKLEPDSARVAKVQAELVDRVGNADARSAAWQAVVQRGDAEQRCDAHIRLAALAREANEHARSAGHFEAALDDNANRDPELARELRLDLAGARGAAGDHAGAETALAAVEAVVPADDTQNLRARVAGLRGWIALARDEQDRALACGEAARDGAVEHNDVMTYLSACSLIAAVYERRQQLVEAYDTYVRARESLGDLLGEQGKQLIEPAVKLFEERLGADEFKRVWDAWVAMRRRAQQA